jgi:hypothetical protein
LFPNTNFVGGVENRSDLRHSQAGDHAQLHHPDLSGIDLRQLAQFFLNQRQEFFGGLSFALLHAIEDARDLAHGLQPSTGKPGIPSK